MSISTIRNLNLTLKVRQTSPPSQTPSLSSLSLTFIFGKVEYYLFWLNEMLQQGSLPPLPRLDLHLSCLPECPGLPAFLYTQRVFSPSTSVIHHMTSKVPEGQPVKPHLRDKMYLVLLFKLFTGKVLVLPTTFQIIWGMNVSQIGHGYFRSYLYMVLVLLTHEQFLPPETPIFLTHVALHYNWNQRLTLVLSPGPIQNKLLGLHL